MRLFSLQARRANNLGESPGAAMSFTLKTVVREASGHVGVVIARWRLRALVPPSICETPDWILRGQCHG